MHPVRLHLRLSWSAYRSMMCTVGSLPAEAGGLLLGPAQGNEITEFWFDEEASCTRTTYTPSVATMNRLLKEVWRPQGLDWKGMAHSHPARYATLSPEDMDYIQRLLRGSPDLFMFWAPLLIPELYVCRFFVVCRDNPSVARKGNVLVEP